MKDSVVTAAVVTSRVENGVEEQSIWVAVCSKDGLYHLVSCIFGDHDIASLKLIGQEKYPVHPKLYESVSGLCEITHIYVIVHSCIFTNAQLYK